MPPKKDPRQSASKLSADSADLSDISLLPALNDFTFVTLYAFKHRLAQEKVEEALLAELDQTRHTEQTPEIVELQKRNKVIAMKDLIDNADQRGYMPATELTSDHSSVKAVQALARSCNDLLLGY